jgi:hypothetical protein
MPVGKVTDDWLDSGPTQPTYKTYPIGSSKSSVPTISIRTLDSSCFVSGRLRQKRSDTRSSSVGDVLILTQASVCGFIVGIRSKASSCSSWSLTL